KRLSQEAERTLVRRLKARDERALGELYDVLAPWVLGLACRILHDEAEAEEVVGDVFAQVWRHVHRHDARRGPLVPWILAIARNRALDALRRRRRWWRKAERWEQARAAGQDVDAPTGPDEASVPGWPLHREVAAALDLAARGGGGAPRGPRRGRQRVLGLAYDRRLESGAGYAVSAPRGTRGYGQQLHLRDCDAARAGAGVDRRPARRGHHLRRRGAPPLAGALRRAGAERARPGVPTVVHHGPGDEDRGDHAHGPGSLDGHGAGDAGRRRARDGSRDDHRAAGGRGRAAR